MVEGVVEGVVEVGVEVEVVVEGVVEGVVEVGVEVGVEVEVGVVKTAAQTESEIRRRNAERLRTSAEWIAGSKAKGEGAWVGERRWPNKAQLEIADDLEREAEELEK